MALTTGCFSPHPVEWDLVHTLPRHSHHLTTIHVHFEHDGIIISTLTERA